jgi:peptide methionine sulfoxide reductase MsrA
MMMKMTFVMSIARTTTSSSSSSSTTGTTRYHRCYHHPRSRQMCSSFSSSSSSSFTSSVSMTTIPRKRRRRQKRFASSRAISSSDSDDTCANITTTTLATTTTMTTMMAMLLMMNFAVEPAEAGQITNYLAAGNYSFLEREYQDLTYAGVSLVDVGTCDGKQCVKVTYDDEKVPFERIMRVYFKHFDPKNASKGQYSEVGEQYKPAVYVNSEKEKTYVNDSLDKLERSRVFGRNLADNWVSNIPVLDAQSVKFEREQDDGKRNVMKTNPKSLEKLSKARDAQFDQLWGFVQFCYERVCGYVRFAPACVGECQEVFPEFLSRNSGVPELEGDVKITGGTYKA